MSLIVIRLARRINKSVLLSSQMHPAASNLTSMVSVKYEELRILLSGYCVKKVVTISRPTFSHCLKTIVTMSRPTFSTVERQS